MRSPIAKFALAAACVVSASTLGAKESLGVFEQWAAFRDAAQNRCYAIAMPLASASQRDYQPFASIGNWPRRKVRNQVYFKLGRNARVDSRISLRVGNTWYKMAGRGADAWAADAGTNAAILAGMRSSQSMTIAATDMRGNRFTDRYPMEGAATAMDAALVSCGR